MKQGQYFTLPEGPSDMSRLWDQAIPLQPGALPAWLMPEDAPTYRRLLAPHRRPLSSAERESYVAELRVLEDIGLVVEEDPSDVGAHQVYLAAPPVEEVWSIGIYSGRSPDHFQPLEEVPNPVLTRDDVTDVPASFVADPFLIREAGIWHMFFEVMNWKSGKGEIGWATSEDGRRWNYRQIVLAEAFHLSYPYVFAWRGNYYMVPESFQAGAVRLYQATSFPTRWSLVCTMLQGDYLVDASIFRHAERWWLLVDASTNGQHDTLRLHSADDLRGPWREHPHSPIVQGNPHDARPAGRVVVHDGRVIRYAQNSVPCYGTDVRGFEITELTSTQYRERPLSGHPVLGPGNAGWNRGGMHHIDPHPLESGSWLAAVDGWFRDSDTAAISG